MDWLNFYCPSEQKSLYVKISPETPFYERKSMMVFITFHMNKKGKLNRHEQVLK